MTFPASESDVLALAECWLEEEHRVALAKVVRTRGSAPRPTGSHFAVRDDSVCAGSVSAGCVEGNVIETALAVLSDGQHRKLSFGADGGDIFETGLMCGGRIKILVGPIT